MRAVLLSAMLLVPGCVLPGDAAGTSGIHGQVLIGPTCPVEKNPPESRCEDRGYEGTLAVMDEGATRVIKEFDSEPNGTFRVPVPPGTYAIRHAAQPNMYPECSTNETVTVTAGTYTWVTVHCDSGIR
jgi:hypothetical protein